MNLSIEQAAADYGLDPAIILDGLIRLLDEGTPITAQDQLNSLLEDYSDFQ